MQKAHFILHYSQIISHWTGAASLELYCTEEMAAWQPSAGEWGQEEGGGATALYLYILHSTVLQLTVLHKTVLHTNQYLRS